MIFHRYFLGLSNKPFANESEAPKAQDKETDPQFPVRAFYKGESQEKNFPGDWKEQRFLPVSPAQVMLGGSWVSLFS
ncbi:MAG: hypothetical protein WA657_17630, partial [Candidatus Acidiferrales bacterium]